MHQKSFLLKQNSERLLLNLLPVDHGISGLSARRRLDSLCNRSVTHNSRGKSFFSRLLPLSSLLSLSSKILFALQELFSFPELFEGVYATDFVGVSYLEGAHLFAFSKADTEDVGEIIFSLSIVVGDAMQR